MIDALITAAVVVGGVPAAFRWWRIAQREHYLAPWTTRFALRWHLLSPLNIAALVVSGAAIVAAVAVPAAALVVVATAGLTPVGLPVRGRSSALSWTRRLRTVAATSTALALAVVVLGALAGQAPAAAAAVVVAFPAIVDAALAVLAPGERRAARRFVTQATERLRRLDPTTVAITGSYGKTTTKVLAAHLLDGHVRAVASPASFNNTAGLSRTVNEYLGDDVEVFIAEMGTYGPGEISSMCAWVRPDIGVMTAIGPVHLERMGSLDGIVAAKREILDGVEVAVVNIDAHGLAAVAGEVAAEGTRVVRCSTRDATADVVVATADDGTLDVTVAGSVLAQAVTTEADASNVACALGIVLAVGVEPERVVDRLADLPTAEHRRTLVTAATGATIIDDTFNANPAGAAAALDQLQRLAATDRRRVVVTPGMIELGALQHDENERFAARAAAVATHVVVVGRTNRAALLAGARRGNAEVIEVATRDEAVAWVRAQTAGGDVILYENDLPDHFP